MNSWLARIAGWIVSFAIGAFFGAAGTISHASLPTPIPIGLIVAALGCLSILVALRCLADDRWAVMFAGLGMFGSLLVFSLRGPGGSVIVPQTPLAMVWMVTLGVIILFVLAWPNMKRLPPVAVESRP